MLHRWFVGAFTVGEAHTQATAIECDLYAALPTLRDVLLHAEPLEVTA